MRIWSRLQTALGLGRQGIGLRARRAVVHRRCRRRSSADTFFAEREESPFLDSPLPSQEICPVSANIRSHLAAEESGQEL